MNPVFQNLESDFTSKFVFYDSHNDKIPVPSFDFKLVFKAAQGGKQYEVGRIDGKFEKCLLEDDYTLLVIFEDHELGAGELLVKFVADLTNSLYEKGYQRYRSPRKTGIIMTHDRSSGDGRVDSALIFEHMQGESSYDIAVKSGYKGTYSEYVALVQNYINGLSGVNLLTPKEIANEEEMQRMINAGTVREGQFYFIAEKE